MKTSSAPFNLGQALGEAVTLHQQGRLREAERLYARVLKAAPDHFDALNLLGAIKIQHGQFGEAQRLFAAAVKANPRIADGWSNLGQAQHALKRPADALQSFDRARALAPDDVGILYQHANALIGLKRHGEALAELQTVLARKPQHFEARLNSGLAHEALGFLERALADFDAAVTLSPQHPVAHFNRGVVLIKLGRYAEAVAANERAIASAPDRAIAWLNRGMALAQLRRFDQAIASYDEALKRERDHVDALFNRALARLTIGDYRGGFADYEWRWRRTGVTAPKSRGRRLWLGDFAPKGKTILLHAEQGLGDTIQFARYAPLVAAQDAKVVLEVPPELKSLLARLDGVRVAVARGEAPPPFDAQCPLGSLPLALKTELPTIPAPIPYLAAADSHLRKWSAQIGALPRPRIAVAWAGNPAHDNDRNRSIAMSTLAPLFFPAGEERAAASFISIQRELRGDEAAQLAAQPRLTHIGGELADFDDTAAVLALCDLLITVDTAPAHLAGAMGRPVWVLVPFAPDWRWTLEGETTPWYPTARIFRQPALGDWSAVIARVAAALQAQPF
jgi:tetratricopeptide (TPR) repeat protein